MIISNDYSVLKKSNTLFIVAGRKTAKILRIRKGRLYEKETILIETPKYSDREGRFEHRALRGNKLLGSGSVYEQKKNYLLDEFFSKLSKEVKNIERTYDSIYLFAPQDLTAHIIEELPNKVSKKIKKTFEGNYTKVHPNKLLEQIKSEREDNVEAFNRGHSRKQVRKILKRPKPKTLPN